MTDVRSCPVCDEPILGRIDKKFCSDQCRNEFNNKKNSTLNLNLVRTINRMLKRNRDILMELNPDGKRKVHRNMLVEKGFNFDYITQVYTTQKGSTYYLCYDQGYLNLENDYILLIKWQESK
ncbi:MAG: DUF2116 family Zn-ribbon domain-containing protein [Bacteroidales bacterium]|nr:DUF2116 family Zn-ribbon domain-containing protein [Bacteroidales bacterium]